MDVIQPMTGVHECQLTVHAFRVLAQGFFGKE